MEDLISNLFVTKAINACKADKPFWYTSGKIGVYFINAEFLYGSEEESKKLLINIDEALSDHWTLPKKVFEQVLSQYNSNNIYKFVIDNLVETISKNIDINEIDYISGGERRDWVFSNIVAYLLKKPHITIFKDLSAILNNSDFSKTEEINTLEGKNVLHISDLITEAASYVNLWIPSIENLGGKIKWTATIVDRMQGGSNRLAKHDIVTYPLVKVDKSLFKTALEKERITKEQYLMIDSYMNNPDETMRDFLIKHPEFIKESLKATGKTLIRARKCVEEDIYGLGDLISGFAN